MAADRAFRGAVVPVTPEAIAQAAQRCQEGLDRDVAETRELLLG